MTTKKTKMFVETSQKDGKFNWKLQFEEFLSQTIHADDGLYFVHTPFLDFAGRGETPEEAYSNLLKIVSSYIFSLWANNQLESFAEKMGWNLTKQDDGGFVIVTDTVKIKSASQPTKKTLYDIFEGKEAEITNPEILERLNKLNRGEYEGKLKTIDFSKLKTSKTYKNALSTAVVA